MNLKEMLARSSGLVVASSAFNMLSTIAIARFFGADDYASYIIDLAYLSFFLLMLDLLPSSYSVFKMQDDESYTAILTTFYFFMALLASSTVAAVNLTPQIALFNNFSWWMIAYIYLFSLKRYLDIKYQAENRLTEYFFVDFLSAILRVIGLIFVFSLGVKSSDGIWGSLAVATLLSQAYWLLRKPEDLPSLSSLSVSQTLLFFGKEIANFKKYYFGTVLKKIKDNIVPIAASFIFVNREIAGAFLLGFRGILFSCGLLRTVEGFLNHRGNIELLKKLSNFQFFVVPIAGHVIAICAAIAISLLSGVEADYLTIAILGIYVYPYFINITMRAKFYAGYNPMGVSWSLVAGIFTMLLGTFLLSHYKLIDSFLFSLLLVLSECAILVCYFQQIRYLKEQNIN